MVNTKWLSTVKGAKVIALLEYLTVISENIDLISSGSHLVSYIYTNMFLALIICPKIGNLPPMLC